MNADRRRFACRCGLLGFLSGDRWLILDQVEINKQRSSMRNKSKALIAVRTAARARKDFEESDRIRDELVAMGVVIKDGKDVDGKPVTTWEIAR